jgi:N-methylhydantoinase B
MNSIALTLLAEQLEGIAQEMGSALARAAFSPNIRVRLDFSCALFSAQGELLAQAAHIPVHLGSMPAHVRRLIESRTLRPGELYLGNDPFDGGTHLPDLTLLRPVFNGPTCLGVAAVRAHHADVGGPNPGSMSSQRDIYGEGLRLPLIRVAEQDVWNEELRAVLLANMRSPSDRKGDLLAQQAACRVGEDGLLRLFHGWAAGQPERWNTGHQYLFQSTHKLVSEGLSNALPQGCVAHFSDLLECAGETLPICVALGLEEGRLVADFAGTAPAVAASFNAPLPVTQACLAYLVSCLMKEPVAINEGLLCCLEVRAPKGCLVHAQHPAAVAAGNVETSQRLVDVLLGALHQLLPQQIPAASAGSMNNLSFGFPCGSVHYETAGGGCGGHPEGPGSAALQVHMTNTRSTPSEVLEIEFPVRVVSHAIRLGSGGEGEQPGGDGTVKLLEFLKPATLTLMATRRTTRPYGLEGGGHGQPGRQATQLAEGDWTEQPGSFTVSMPAGSRFLLETPGGGGYGRPVKTNGALERSRDSSA